MNNDNVSFARVFFHAVPHSRFKQLAEQVKKKKAEAAE